MALCENDEILLANEILVNFVSLYKIV